MPSEFGNWPDYLTHHVVEAGKRTSMRICPTGEEWDVLGYGGESVCF
ncbi:hypothetical protein ACFLZ1_04735 [Patescibacteria group bacterium]